jgi:hypothetical protein
MQHSDPVALNKRPVPLYAFKYIARILTTTGVGQNALGLKVAHACLDVSLPYTLSHVLASPSHRLESTLY